MPKSCHIELILYNNSSYSSTTSVAFAVQLLSWSLSSQLLWPSQYSFYLDRFHLWSSCNTVYISNRHPIRPSNSRLTILLYNSIWNLEWNQYFLPAWRTKSLKELMEPSKLLIGQCPVVYWLCGGKHDLVVISSPDKYIFTVDVVQTTINYTSYHICVSYKIIAVDNV